jgi:spermidine synthase
MRDDRLILLAIGMLGVSAVMTQLALLRELLSAFHGNELALGAILGGWLFLTGLGCQLGRAGEKVAAPALWLCLAQISIALLPLGQVWAVRALRDVVFIRGAEVGYAPAALSSILLLLPYCLISGFMLTWACGLAGHLETPPWVGRGSDSFPKLPAGSTAGVRGSQATSPAAALGAVYVADSLGSIGGGLLFSFVLVSLFDHFALLSVPAFLNLLVAARVAWRFQLKLAGGLALACLVGLAALLLTTDPDALTTALQYPRQTVVFRGSSPYGRLIVTEQAGQLNFIENGLPIISSHQTEWAEESVHYALAQRPTARRVLLVGGAFSGTIAEILKYDPQEVTCLELDRLITDTAKRFMPAALADPRVVTVNTDGRLFLKQTTRKFDAILVNVPDPSTSLLNRFYTTEFLGEAKRALASDGVLCFGLGHYENFVSPDLARLLATAYRTTASVFTNVMMIPGGRVFYLASDGLLFGDIAARLEQSRIPTKLVKRQYLEALLAPDRTADLRHAVEQSAHLNTDFSPVLYFYHLRHWMSQFDTKPGPAFVALGVLLVVYLAQLRAPTFAVFASGFSASSLEVVLLLGLQALCGSLYQQLGLVVTTFMAGLAAGAFWVGRHDLRTAPERHEPARVARLRGRGGASDLSHAVPRPPEGGTLTQRAPGNDSRPRQSSDPTGGLHTNPAASLSPARKLALAAFGLAALALALPVCLHGLSQWDSARHSPLLVQAAILLMTFLVALLVGMEFPLAALSGPTGTIQLNHETHQTHERKTTTSHEEPEAGASASSISSVVTQKPSPHTKPRSLFSCLSCVSWLLRRHGHGSSSPATAASRIYTADFIGAGLGALLASAWLIPLFGLGWTCLLVALLNLLAGASLGLRKPPS